MSVDFLGMVLFKLLICKGIKDLSVSPLISMCVHFKTFCSTILCYHILRQSVLLI